MKKTPIQRIIERNVTNGRGYDFDNTSRIPFSLIDTEIGLQTALANMDTREGKLDMYKLIGFSSQLEAMIKKFNEAGIPLETITTAEGFKAAFDSAYFLPKPKSRTESLFRLNKIEMLLPGQYSNED